jgi:hypothetical protein
MPRIRTPQAISLAAFIVFSIQSRASCAENASQQLPAEIRTALEKNVAALSPTISVSWTTQHDSPLSPRAFGRLSDDKPGAAAARLNTQEEVRFTWQSDDCYRAIDITTPIKQIPAGPTPGRIRYSFDGKTFYTATANAGEPHSVLRTDFDDEAKAKDDDAFVSASYFEVLGLWLPLTRIELKQHKPAHSEIIDALSDGKASVAGIDTITIDDQPTTRLHLHSADPVKLIAPTALWRPAPDTFVYLVPKDHYAIRRIEAVTTGGAVIWRMDATDFYQVPERELYLAKTINLDEFDENKMLLISTTWHATPATIKPVRPEAFALTDNTPGTWFIDHYGPRQQVNILQKDGMVRPQRDRRKPSTQLSPGEHGL